MQIPLNEIMLRAISWPTVIVTPLLSDYVKQLVCKSQSENVGDYAQELNCTLSDFNITLGGCVDYIEANCTAPENLNTLIEFVNASQVNGTAMGVLVSLLTVLMVCGSTEFITRYNKEKVNNSWVANGINRIGTSVASSYTSLYRWWMNVSNNNSGNDEEEKGLISSSQDYSGYGTSN